MIKAAHEAYIPRLEEVRRGEETVWINRNRLPAEEALKQLPFDADSVKDASLRLDRFAPFLKKAFPETAPLNGRIESPLTEIPRMREYLIKNGAAFGGRLLIKRDCDLSVAGSVKARGGIYEVLKHTEDLALENGLLSGPEESTGKLLDPACREFFSGRKIQVGSTGNLGLSIGIMSAAIGYDVRVHMSADAKQWKKDLLRSKGVTVIEYEGDYGEACRIGRAGSLADPTSYFVDDERSKDLFLGYTVAAERLKAQLEEKNIPVDAEHPLYVYIPCGVGGAPGGILFGLKLLYGDNAHVFFIEPTQAPCMLLALATGLHEKISVQDIGLTGKTEADGLAVGRASGLIADVAEHLLDGELTVEDQKLRPFLKALWKTERIFAEPSACAPFRGVTGLFSDGEIRDPGPGATHIVWATGGSLIPASVREELLSD